MGPYYDATFENDENGVCPHDDQYSLLLGPHGFECSLGEPEDRTWGRDGQDVVKELNRLHALAEFYKDAYLAVKAKLV